MSLSSASKPKDTVKPNKSSSGSLRPKSNTSVQTDDIPESLYPSQNSYTKPPRNRTYEEEIVLIFYNSMLGYIVEDVVKSKFPEPDLSCQDIEVEKEISTRDVSPTASAQSFQAAGSKHSKQSNLSGTHSRRRSKDTIASSTSSKRRKSSSSKAMPKISEDCCSSKLSSKLEGHSIKVDSSTSTGPWRLRFEDEYITCKYKNGDVYRGPVSNNLFHGTGVYCWADGTTYIGQFENGCVTGQGKMDYVDRSTYHGAMLNGKPHGHGSFYVAYTGTLYTGNWKYGQKDGKGWLFYGENNWYDGEWLKDSRHGIGTRLYRNGTKYSGNWYEGQRNGFGSVAFANGDFYSGEWNLGTMHGYGEYTWKAYLNKSLTFPLENIYQGAWRNGAREGQGLLFFGLDGGAHLNGVWELNLKHGAGTITYDNGEILSKNPLFLNDKPCQQTVSADSYDRLRTMVTNSAIMKSTGSLSLQNTMISSQAWIRLKSHEGTHESLDSVCTTLNAQGSGTIGTPIFAVQRGAVSGTISEMTTEDKRDVHKIERIQDFPENKQQCNPILYPIRCVPETVDLSHYVMKFIQKTKNCDRSPYCSDESMARLDRVDSRVDSQDSFWEDTLIGETNHLHTVIKQQSTVLRTVYNMYATITGDGNESKEAKTVLIRLYLWQLYRDMNIYKRGLSLIDTDKILLENPMCNLVTEHYPFERIYFWQFLWSLLGVAWYLYSDIEIADKNKSYGVMGTIFLTFLQDMVYPSAGNHVGPCLFEFNNMLPIRDVYSLYAKLGEVITARQFVNACCVKKGTQPPCYMHHFGDSDLKTVQQGVNTISVGHNFIFIIEEKDSIEMPTEKAAFPLERDGFFKTMKVFRHLGPKRIISCLKLSCPIIMKDNIIVNLDCRLTFLEFYEALIFCAYRAILQSKFREKVAAFTEIKRTQNPSKVSQKIKKSSSALNNATRKKRTSS